MKIQNFYSNRNNVYFSSKNCPIEPFVIQTSNGPLYCEELQKSDINKAAKFSYRTSINEFPSWKKEFKTATYTDRKNQFLDYINDFHKPFKDNNSTVLIGKNSNSEIKVLFSLFPYKTYWLKDRSLAHLEECMIAPEYQRKGIGRIFLQKIEKTTIGNFTDILGEAYKKATGFYINNGYNFLDQKNPQMKRASDYIMSIYPEPNITKLVTKNLDSSNVWWKRFANIL